MRFTKMEGLGNDYVYVDCLHEDVPHPSNLAKIVSDRHFGIGSDGLILIRPSACADFFMEMFNADGSRSEMCGNGIRCVGKFVYDRGLTDKTELAVNTLAGVKRLQLHVEGGKVGSVTVDMGAPELRPAVVPVIAPAPEGDPAAPVVSQPFEVAGDTYLLTCVSMGNPHAVAFVDDVSTFPVAQAGRALEFHEAFPRRVNAEFVQVINRSEINMRVWERGTGETLACGTGACASAVACILNDLTADEVTVHLLGGDLRIRWDRASGHVLMTGPATTVFEGELDTDGCPADVAPHVIDPAW